MTRNNLVTTPTKQTSLLLVLCIQHDDISVTSNWKTYWLQKYVANVTKHIQNETIIKSKNIRLSTNRLRLHCGVLKSILYAAVKLCEFHPVWYSSTIKLVPSFLHKKIDL